MTTLHRWTCVTIACCTAVLTGCAKTDNAAETDTAAASATGAMPAEPAPISLADVAGKWDVRSTPESGDTSTTTYVLTATGTTSGWTITRPNRQPIPVRITTAGDSIISEAGPFESVRRRGVQVNTNDVFRLQGGNLVGTTVAHYMTTGPDSVLRLRLEGTRAP